uniref:PPM-type phosphatase domain-containing protein n=1 Tax=Globisporangium ultimum (strain ATCC 200006 / CBS 805.95 / DAOM BR144) TaxID=431595 RepID=K3WGS3_GLOUD
MPGVKMARVLRRFNQQNNKKAASSIRQALLVSGIGLSVLALANGDAAGADVSSTAQCDARYTPAYSGNDADFDASSFQLPLDGERFEKLEKSHAKRFSCATYKANSPIEDRFDVQTTASGDVYAAVFDGHGGWQVSEYVSKTLIGNIQKELSHAFKDPERESEKPASSKKIASAIQRAFGRTDRELMVQVAPAFKLGFGAVARCGSCALFTLIHADTLHVANAGDIRAVLGKTDPANKSKLLAVPLSNDQNAMVKVEQEKLKKEHPGEANAFTCRHPESCYVKGALQPTRAFGDFSLKYPEFNGRPYVNGDRTAGRHFAEPYSPPYITAIPEIKSYKIDSNDRFVIIGSDGLWDFLSNEEAVEVVREQIALGNYEHAGRALVERTLQKAAKRYEISYADLLSLPPGSHRRRRHDDTTVVVLFFD